MYNDNEGIFIKKFESILLEEYEEIDIDESG